MSTKLDDGGPAFPLSDSGAIAYAQMREDLAASKLTDGDRAYYEAKLKAQGMTLRDHFAGLAMQAAFSGHIAHYGHDSNHWSTEDIASHAYEQADAMLKARQQ